MTTHEVDFLEIKAKQQSPKLVNSGKGAFAGKAVFVDGRIE